MKPMLALRRYMPSNGQEKVKHVLVWNKRQTTVSTENDIGVEKVNAFLMARNIEELLYAIEEIGYLTPTRFDLMHNNGWNLEEPDRDLLAKEDMLFPFSENTSSTASMSRAIKRWSINGCRHIEDDEYVIEDLNCWVALHNFLYTICAIITLPQDEERPLSLLGFERHPLKMPGRHGIDSKERLREYTGWSVRFEHNGWAGDKPYHWLWHNTGDISDTEHDLYLGRFTMLTANDQYGAFFCLSGEKDERRMADAWVNEMAHVLLSMTCHDGTLVAAHLVSDTFQQMWSVIYGAIINYGCDKTKYRLFRCPRCGRVLLAKKTGRERKFCCDSCRVLSYKEKTGRAAEGEV